MVPLIIGLDYFLIAVVLSIARVRTVAAAFIYRGASSVGLDVELQWEVILQSGWERRVRGCL